MKIVLVTFLDKPITVGVGGFPFTIENGQISHNDNCRVGARMTGNLSNYNEAYDLACFAWENQIFDLIEKH